MPIPTIQFTGEKVRIIDQTRLPLEKSIISIESGKEMWDAIKTLKVRGAPAIGIAAAFGVYLGVAGFRGDDSRAFLREVESACVYMESSRPTAVNLFWATKRI
jgi:methylthioribose-1-phosphate isomerase